MNFWEEENQEIKRRLSLKTLAENSGVKLTRRGKTYNGLCPFHDDSTPSFRIYQNDSFYCFGCQRGGDIFNFQMEKASQDFWQAKQDLARQAGVEIRSRLGELSDETFYIQRQERQDDLKGVLVGVFRYYRNCLQSQPQIQKYLHDRGFNTKNGPQFGYAPRQKVETFCGAVGFSREDLVAAGVLGQVENGNYYLRFQDRVIVPIKDRHGRTVSLAGRTVSKDPTQAKWLNGPETEIFKKGQVLFGLDKAKHFITGQNSVYVVEGYFDQLIMDQSQLSNTVALMGISMRADHFRTLSYIKSGLRIYLIFDGDKAGQESTNLDNLLNLIKLSQDYGQRLFIVSLPDGKDPDQMVLEDRSGLRKLIDEAPSALLYYTKMAERQCFPSSNPEDANYEYIRLMCRALALLNSVEEREVHIAALAKKTGIAAARINAIINRAFIVGPENVNYQAYLKNQSRSDLNQEWFQRTNPQLVQNYEKQLLMGLIRHWPRSFTVEGADEHYVRSSDFEDELNRATFDYLASASMWTTGDEAFTMVDVLETISRMAEDEEEGGPHRQVAGYLAGLYLLCKDYKLPPTEENLKLQVADPLNNLRAFSVKKFINEITDAIMASESEEEIEELTVGVQNLMELYLAFQQ